MSVLVRIRIILIFNFLLFLNTAKHECKTLLEFNPGRLNYPGSKADYTYDWLSYLYGLNCRVVCPLSWLSNALDTGIKDSRMDDGIKRFVQQGPSGTISTSPADKGF